MCLLLLALALPNVSSPFSFLLLSRSSEDSIPHALNKVLPWFPPLCLVRLPTLFDEPVPGLLVLGALPLPWINCHGVRPQVSSPLSKEGFPTGLRVLSAFTLLQWGGVILFNIFHRCVATSIIGFYILVQPFYFLVLV